MLTFIYDCLHGLSNQLRFLCSPNLMLKDILLGSVHPIPPLSEKSSSSTRHIDYMF